MVRPLRTHTGTVQDTTITQSMPGQYVQTLYTYRHSTGHVQTSLHTYRHSTGYKVCLVSIFRPLHTYRHSTGHHDHTKYAWSACLDLFTLHQAQHRTSQSHKVCLVSMFGPLCTLSGTAQDTTITQSMPGQHVQTSLHTYRHITITQSMAL